MIQRQSSVITALPNARVHFDDSQPDSLLSDGLDARDGRQSRDTRNSELMTEIVWLDWHDRRKVRQRAIGDAGTELLLSLPRGTVLVDGQVLFRDIHRQVVVRAKAQPLLAIAPSSVQESCRVAHHLGNWHRPIRVDDDGKVWVESDRPVLDWLERSNIPFEEIDAPFEPNSIAHNH